MQKFNNGKYDGLCTSNEILAAIERIAGDDILDHNSYARRIWDAPTPAEETMVCELAFKQAAAGGPGADETVLFWGESQIKRPLSSCTGLTALPANLSIGGGLDL